MNKYQSAVLTQQNIRSDLQFSAFSEVAKQEFALDPQQYQKETDQRITAITSDLSEADTTRLSARLREVQLAGLHDIETGMHTRMEGEAAKQSLQTIDGLMAGLGASAIMGDVEDAKALHVALKDMAVSALTLQQLSPQQAEALMTKGDAIKQKAEAVNAAYKRIDNGESPVAVYVNETPEVQAVMQKREEESAELEDMQAAQATAASLLEGRNIVLQWADAGERIPKEKIIAAIKELDLGVYEDDLIRFVITDKVSYFSNAIEMLRYSEDIADGKELDLLNWRADKLAQFDLRGLVETGALKDPDFLNWHNKMVRRGQQDFLTTHAVEFGMAIRDFYNDVSGIFYYDAEFLNEPMGEGLTRKQSWLKQAYEWHFKHIKESVSIRRENYNKMMDDNYVIKADDVENWLVLDSSLQEWGVPEGVGQRKYVHEVIEKAKAQDEQREEDDINAILESWFR